VIKGALGVDDNHALGAAAISDRRSDRLTIAVSVSDATWVRKLLHWQTAASGALRDRRRRWGCGKAWGRSQGMIADILGTPPMARHGDDQLLHSVSRRRYDTRRPLSPQPYPFSSRFITIQHKLCTSDRHVFPNIVSGMIEELERALALAAYIVLRHGPIYAPYIDRLERELENARAKRILQTYTVEGGRKAIRSSHSRLCSSAGPTP
jgi:hypothetical protein